MDISKLSHGAKLVLAGTVVFLIASFFNWQEVELGDFGSAGVSMWHGWGVLAGLLAIALLVWEGLRLANIEVSLPTTPAMVSAFLAILIGLFTVIKFLADNEFRTFWAWLGLILAIAIVVGAIMNMQAAGQSFSDMKNTITSGAAAATAAAKGAAESAQSSSSSSAAPSSEPAPSTGGTVGDAAETASDAVDGDDKPAA